MVSEFKWALASEGSECIYNWVGNEGGWRNEYNESNLKMAKWLADFYFFKEKK